MLPVDTKERIDQYVLRGIPPGSFLSAVLAEDLFGAVTEADEDNLPNLKSVCRYVIDTTPATCRGSYADVSGWLSLLARHGNDLNDVPMSER